MHDARVLRNSPLFQSAENQLFQGDTHLLGDSAYPLQRCIFLYQYIIPMDVVLVVFVDKSIPYCIFMAINFVFTIANNE